jgi:hypothetical protein
MSNPDRVRVTGPLAAFKDGFAAELVRQGYRPNAVACQLQLMAHLGRWMAVRGVDAAGLVAGRFRRIHGETVCATAPYAVSRSRRQGLRFPNHLDRCG